MREIKYRGLERGGGWIYSDINDLDFWIDVIRDRIIKETITQFTGLKDKSGKEIYEGDVLSDIHDRTFEVCWQSGYEPEMEVGFWLKKTYINEIFPFHYTKDIKHLGMKVIGNIYDNPELFLKD